MLPAGAAAAEQPDATERPADEHPCERNEAEPPGGGAAQRALPRQPWFGHHRQGASGRTGLQHRLSGAGATAPAVHQRATGARGRPEGEEFGTVVFETGNVTVDVVDSKITANTVDNSEFSAFQWNSDIVPAETVKDNKITVSGASEIKTTGSGNAQIAETGSNNEVVIETGVKSDLDVPTEYLPEGTKTETDENGNTVVVPDTIVLTLNGVYDGELIPDAKAEVKDIIRNTVFDDEAIEDLNDLVENVVVENTITAENVVQE